ncbi:MAG: DUF2149 domain-containing protein [Methanosarcinales archaeon]|jgi:hypothetical protein|nr:DUF2149 domain-containing protein [Methanosarcinales archaeon]MRG76951.1 DUF2149 domain-containing protein [ANME-2 cluster archaeon]
MRSKHTGRRRKGLLDQESESNPLSGVANLFDVAMVFAVALLIALVMSYHLPEMLDPDASFTVVKNPGEPGMKIIVKDGVTIEVMNMTENIAGGAGEELGTAYKLANGKVIYVPANGTE